MLKLVKCEFAKLKRKKFILFVFLSAFLFPVPITFLMATPRMLARYPDKTDLFDGLFNMVMGYGVIFLLPCIIGVIAAMLFFMERDNDTFKNLRTIPVTSTQMIAAKVIVLFVFGIIFCLASMLATIICGSFSMEVYGLTDSNLNHTGIYLYSKGKIMIHLTFDYKTDEKCTTPGQYLKYHRTFQGLSTRELAEKVGIVPATLVLYENDRHPIKHSTAVALANALGIDRNRLLDKYTAFVDYPYSSLLKKVRQELSLTQMQMAEVIGIGQTSYSGWEREIRVPRRKEYEKILAALKKLKVNVDTYLCHPAST